MPPADYLVTCIPGLEDIASLEIRESLSAEILEARRGRVRFRAAAGSDDLLELRSIEHRHVWLAGFDLGVDPETAVRTAMLEADLEPFLKTLRLSQDLPDQPAFRITGRREGEHDFTSEDVQRWAGASVVRRYGWPVRLEEFDLEIFVKVDGESGWIAGRLPGGPGRKRPWQQAHHPAAINPLIAYGMARIAAPAPAERVLDPFCGSGTLLIESALFQPAARWFGADRDDRPLPMARANAEAAGVHLPLVRADARGLPWKERSFDLVLGNLPFGRRSGSHNYNRKVYFPFFNHLPRILRPGGRAVVLTLERRLMGQIVKETPVRLVSERRISQSGLFPSLYVLSVEDPERDQG